MSLLLSAISSSCLLREQLMVAAPSIARVYGSIRFPANFIRLFSSKKLGSSDEKPSFTVSYLINSCGLSSKAAISASKKLHLNSPENPDLVLKLLNNHGFSKAQISKLVSRFPAILNSDPELTILPKLQFFHSIGMRTPVLTRLASANPVILKYSLQNSIIPAYNNLKILCKTNERVVHFINRVAVRYDFIHGVLKHTHSNVALLRKYGVSESCISFLVTNHPGTLVIASDRLAKLVNTVVGFGINTTKIIFLHALHVILSMSTSSWEHKKAIYQKWGWSESNFLMAFSSYPLFVGLSEKNIMYKMEFLVNEMGCEPLAIARYPVVLSYSLEKRIRPRCQVAIVLMLKKLIKKPYKLSRFLLISNRLFLDKYVTKYQEKIPLLDVYNGKLSFRELGFNYEESEVKLF
ncbi:Mitochondrial transcription termination factor, mTERF [Handroanthus impetiginosus]|uniref:Mitochondrial transcription termination factor, mTERF n=1 Tax=Handroanthus impetiginosus TaxID=429701 RepID=A0A2G9H264_9LAMI|nr:Mitochondrial transcription termination factor, mTERF [Handroanthus impetiginosus]